MSQIQRLVEEIEHELFMLHKDVNFKYKSKYRSFIFNLKDTKNKGLFRKVSCLCSDLCIIWLDVLSGLVQPGA